MATRLEGPYKPTVATAEGLANYAEGLIAEEWICSDTATLVGQLK
jgi:hypothetical protein